MNFSTIGRGTSGARLSSNQYQEWIQKLKRLKELERLLAALSDKWKAEAVQLEKTCDFGRFGVDEFSMAHGKQEALENCAEELSKVIKVQP